MATKGQILNPRISKNPPFSVEASGYEAVEGETIPRRHPASKDKLTTSPSEDVTTIFDILKRSADKFGNAKALGTRRLIKTHQENKKVKKTVDGVTQEVDKKWTYFELSEYSYTSFVQYEKIALEIGAGLRKLGLVKGDRLHLFAGTRCDSPQPPPPFLPGAGFLFSDHKPTNLVLTGLPCLMARCHNLYP